MLNISVTVIIPYFNDIHIVRAYQSVMQQTLKPKEIIIVDDASLDKTGLTQIMGQHSDNNISLRVIHLEKNEGPSFARNLGIKESKYEYIAFLDSDDEWHSQKLEICLNMLCANNSVSFVYHLYIANGDYLSENYNIENIQLKKRSKWFFAMKSYIATPTVVARRDTFIMFPEHIKYCEDYCCWIMNNQQYFYYIDIPLARGFKKPIGDSGLSSSINNMHKGFIDSLFFLKKNKYINDIFFLIALILEYVKLPFRFIR